MNKKLDLPKNNFSSNFYGIAKARNLALAEVHGDATCEENMF